MASDEWLVRPASMCLLRQLLVSPELSKVMRYLFPEANPLGLKRYCPVSVLDRRMMVAQPLLRSGAMNSMANQLPVSTPPVAFTGA